MKKSLIRTAAIATPASAAPSPHILAVMTSLAFAAAIASPASAAPSPHILMVIVDDFGWANVGYHRTLNDDPTGEVKTPTMDSLVSEGIELNQSYAFWYCSPSRSAIQTGRNPIHVNVNNDGLAIHNPADPVSGFAGIPRNMTTIAWKMRESNPSYKTYFYGKW
jgi:arylsulfatase B